MDKLPQVILLFFLCLSFFNLSHCKFLNLTFYPIILLSYLTILLNGMFAIGQKKPKYPSKKKKKKNRKFDNLLPQVLHRWWRKLCAVLIPCAKSKCDVGRCYCCVVPGPGGKCFRTLEQCEAHCKGCAPKCPEFANE